jgi:hypothetical protein
MKFAKFSPALCAFALAALTLASCNKKDEVITPAPEFGEFSMGMDHVIGSPPATPVALALNTGSYTTASGETFTVSSFRYYLSNIKLTRADGSTFAQPDIYYLVDESDVASQEIVVKDVPVGDYTGISFTVGIDSARNVAGAQTGVLAPGQGMYWDWTQGYVFAKLEGNSPQSAATNNRFLYHVGGFRRGSNALRTMSPSMNGVTMKVRTDHSPEMHVKVDALKMLNGPNPMRFADINTIMMAGANAVKVADNMAAGMFRIDHIHAN